MLLLLGGVTACGKKSNKSSANAAAFTRATKIEDHRRRGDQLLRVAQDQHKNNQTGEAAASIKAAMAAARQVEDPYEQCKLLCMGVFLYEAIDFGHETEEAISLAAEMVEKIENVGQRVEISAKLAEIYKRFKDKQSVAELYLEDCEKLAEGIEVLDEQVRAYMVTAYYSHRLDHVEDCDRLVMKALNAATTVADYRQQSDLYGELGTRLLRLDRTGQSTEAFTIAEEGALAVEEDLSRAYTLIDLAVRLKSGGHAGRAKKLLDQAVEIGNAQTESALRRELLDKIRDVQ